MADPIRINPAPAASPAPSGFVYFGEAKADCADGHEPRDVCEIDSPGLRDVVPPPGPSGLAPATAGYSLRKAQAAGAMGIWADAKLLQAAGLEGFAEMLRAQMLPKAQASQLYSSSMTITVRDGELLRFATMAGGPDYLSSAEGERALRDAMTKEPNVFTGFWFSITKRSDSDFDITAGVSTPI